MSDAIDIEGQEFVSAKRAAKETGYTRDYIGQLARGGAIAARRVEGLWYVSLSSLHAYRTKAEEYKSPPPAPTPPPDADATIVFDGKEYVSASRGAKLTGYHQDYIGQLARTGKVISKQMGNRWFVERDTLLLHKKQKDALLAAVQAESVGLASSVPRTIDAESATPVPARTYDEYTRARAEKAVVPREPFFHYVPEHVDLMPDPTQPERPVIVHHIRTMPSFAAPPAAERAVQKQPARVQQQVVRTFSYSRDSRQQNPRKARRMARLAPIVLTIVVVLTLGFTSLRDRAVYAFNQIRGANGAQEASPSNAIAAGPMQGAAEWIETLFSHDIEYTSSGK